MGKKKTIVMDESQNQELQDRSFNRYDSTRKDEHDWEDGFAELEALKRRESGESEEVELSDSTTVRQRQPKVRSQRFKALKKKVKRRQLYDLNDAVAKVLSVTKVNFDASIELHAVSKKDTLSGELELPHGNGKTKVVEVFSDATIAKIEKKQLDFDILVAKPEQMKEIAKYARVLGPRGLMPNPKNGTIVADPQAKAAQLASQKRISYKCEKKAPLIHLVIGKQSQGVDALTQNIHAAILAMNPKLLKKASLASTMSPGVKLNLDSIVPAV